MSLQFKTEAEALKWLASAKQAAPAAAERLDGVVIQMPRPKARAVAVKAAPRPVPMPASRRPRASRWARAWRVAQPVVLGAAKGVLWVAVFLLQFAWLMVRPLVHMVLGTALLVAMCALALKAVGAL